MDAARLRHYQFADEGVVCRKAPEPCHFDRQAVSRLFGPGSLRAIRERLVPFPGRLAESRVVRTLERSGVVRLIRRGTRFLWRLRIWECALPDVRVIEDDEHATADRPAGTS